MSATRLGMNMRRNTVAIGLSLCLPLIFAACGPTTSGTGSGPTTTQPGTAQTTEPTTTSQTPPQPGGSSAYWDNNPIYAGIEPGASCSADISHKGEPVGASCLTCASGTWKQGTIETSQFTGESVCVLEGATSQSNNSVNSDSLVGMHVKPGSIGCTNTTAWTDDPQLGGNGDGILEANEVGKPGSCSNNTADQPTT